MTVRSISLLVLFSGLITTAVAATYLPCASEYGCYVCSTSDQTDPSQQCFICHAGYVLIDNYCQLSIDSCSSRSGHTCTLKNCLVELPLSGRGYYCQECAHPYSSYGPFLLPPDRSYCDYYCPYTGQYVTQVSLCNPKCKANHCHLCSPNDENYCVECYALYLNSKGTCVPYCPIKTYESGSQCLDCDPQCASCTTTSNQCTQCQDASLSNIPSCSCPADTYFYSTSCVSECPYLQTPKDGICQRICPLKEYPFYGPNQSFTCSAVPSYDNDYCIQNIRHISSLISVYFSQSNAEMFILYISLKDTPQACYTYQLIGINSFSFSENSSFNENTSTISYLIFLSQVQNRDYVECQAEKCYIKFLIFWRNLLSYSFQISLKLKLQGDLINSISFNNEIINEDIACETCEIPKYTIISSTISVTCSEGQTCSRDSIKTKVTQPIKITQSISDEALKNRKVFPHSLKISYRESTFGNEAYFYIKDYDFTNDVAGQITYTFYPLPVTDAQLTITSTVTDAKTSRLLSVSSRFLDSAGNSSVRYPQMIMSIKVDEETKTSDSSIILAAVLVPTSCVLLAIAGFWAFRIYKKRQVKLISEKNENQEIQVGQQENDNNGEQVKIPLEIKMNLDASQKTIALLPQDIANPKKIGQIEEILPQNSKRLEKKEESSHGEHNDVIMFEDQSSDQESHNSQ